LIDLVRELVDEVLDGRLVVPDARLEINVHVSPGRVPRDAVEDPALPAAIDGLLHHAVDVGLLVQALRAERVVLAAVGHDHRLLERSDDLLLDDLAGGVSVAAADVYATDLDAGRDLVLLGIVIRPNAHSEQQAQGEQRHEGDQDLLVHFQSCAHLSTSDQLSPAVGFYVPSPPGPLPDAFRNGRCG
jgi:hypothetical protein